MRTHILGKLVILAVMIFFILPSVSPAQIISEQKKAVVYESDFELEYTITFSTENLIFGTLMDYDIVEVKDGGVINDVGKPMMPLKEINIALPEGMNAEAVSVVESRSSVLDGTYMILPAQPPRRTDGSDDDQPFIYPDPSVYISYRPYPSEVVKLLYQSDLSGQSWATIQINPLKYYPADGKLQLVTLLTFRITGSDGYVCGDYLTPTISQENRDNFENQIKDLVINPNDVVLKEYPNKTPLPLDLPAGGPYDYVIIGTSGDSTYWAPLIEWRTKMGMKATYVTTSYIYSEYTGSDNQQKIRNFVIDAHSNWGTMYFLIAGENGDVPFEYRTYEGDSIPSDEYYADYDDDWTMEVYVGRVTATTSTQANIFINKLLKYEKDPELSNYIFDITLLGMDLTIPPDTPTYGEDLKESIDNYIPGDFTVTKVYDSDIGNHETAFINALNDGQNIVNHCDHSYNNFMGTGERNHGWGIYSSDVDGLNNNNKMSNVYSLGCHPLEMDYSDCIGEHFVIYNGLQAGVSFTGNTRSGWFYVGDEDSLSGRLDRYWWRAIFIYNQYQLGKALYHTKQYCSHSDDIERYCHWTLNLLGDPAMPLWLDDPTVITATYPTETPVGGPSSFTVNTNSPYATICLWKGDEVYEVETANSAGDYTFSIAPTTEGTLYVTVTNQDYIPYEGSTEVIPEGDVTPPTPNPMTWSAQPYPISTSEISMTATTASDDTTPIYYYFDFMTGSGSGGTDSSWQISPTYIDSGLEPNSYYDYCVKVRDSADPPNEGEYSSIESTFTYANIPDSPTVNNPTVSTLDISVNPNGNPIYTEFAIQCSSTTDGTWNGKYVDASGNPTLSPVWQIESEWDITTIQNLYEITQYCFHVKARNYNFIETSFGDESCAETADLLFTIEGEVFENDGLTPQDSPTVVIYNLDTLDEWTPSIGGPDNNEYTLDLNIGLSVDISMGDTIRIIAKDGSQWITVYNHTITQNEIDTGGVQIDLILDEYYLDLIDFPMYLAQDIGGYTVDQMTGPAVLQMNLDYVWWNSSVDVDPPTWSENNGWDQAELYDRGVENNSNTSLGYLDATGLHYMIQNLDPEPYSEYGYNFGIYHDVDSEYMLKQIVKWIDYPAGIKPGHPLHVPGAVPTFGDYSRWMSVRGIHMNETAYPLPSALDVYGFWVNDPYPSGIGENTYKTSVEWTNNYYQPIGVTDDPYYGEYIAICEPPLPDEECDLTLVVPPGQWEPLDEPPGQRIGMSAFFLRQVNDDTVVKAAIDGVTDQLIPYDSSFEEVFKQSYAGRPMLVKNLREEKGDYYAVPFTNVPTMQPIPRDGQAEDEDVTLVVVLVDANDGHFKEASWVDDPVIYLSISSADALDIVFDELIDMGINPEDLPARAFNTNLVYRGGYSQFSPEWRITIAELGLTFYINQEGVLTVMI